MAFSPETLGAAIAIVGAGGGGSDLSGRVDAIEGKIPTEASAQNKLADKAYVDESINTSSAFYRGSFATKAALLAVPWQSTSKIAENYVSNNDYAVVTADETHNGESWRYTYVYEAGGSNNGWAAQYRVNEQDVMVKYVAQTLTDAQKSQARTNVDAEKAFETMTMAQYEALSNAQKMDGTVRYITDVYNIPLAEGVGF